MNKKIFLIEDEENDYNLIKEKMTEFEVIPNDYKSGFTEIKEYLNDSSDDNKGKVIAYVIANNINLIILDIKLWDEKNGGIYLYDRIFSQEERLNKIPVIYLTSTTLQSELTLNKYTAYVEKRYNSRGFDVEWTAARIKDEIKNLCHADDSSSQWFINNM